MKCTADPPRPQNPWASNPAPGPSGRRTAHIREGTLRMYGPARRSIPWKCFACGDAPYGWSSVVRRPPGFTGGSATRWSGRGLGRRTSGLAQGPLVDLLVAADDAVGVEERLRPGAGRRGPSPAAARRPSGSRCVRAAMPSMSPTGRRKPVSPCLTTSGRPPASEPTTGVCGGHRLEGREAEGLELGGQEEDVGEGRDVGGALPRARGSGCGRRRRAAGPGPGPRRARGRRRASGGRRPPHATTRSKMRTTSSTRLTGRKFETWSRMRWPGRGVGGAVGRGAAGRVLRRVDEVGDDLDGARDAGTPRWSCA